ncbi:hypothetical protein ACRAQ6_11360 [Erythrobacter sp. HA6-11]
MSGVQFRTHAMNASALNDPIRSLAQASRASKRTSIADQQGVPPTAAYRSV